MSLLPGTQLGNYEVHSELGRGGMGEVYKARDLKLGREVAIKVLPQEMAADSQRLRRFEQEARAASALNHPNIVTIYEIGEHEGTPYIAMEYVEGRTLREMLADGPLANDKLIRYATQMAEGLAKAHQAGIVHRDLKPENIVISDDGYVKILDFGLAKLLPLDGVGSEVATMEKEGTTPGTVLGTVSYMSPEQAKGETVDHRSDQFGFGAIVYEMVTGKKVFERDTAAETLSAVLRDEPTPIGMPVGVESVVRRCLSKARELRYASTAEILDDLNRTTPEPVRPRLRSIAVLPLVNLSADADQEFFADGMTEALITDLAKIRGLRVISRSSAMRFKGTDKPLAEIASELGVDAVLEGSVLRAGERVRISAQLIDAKADEHLWAHRYEENLRDVLQLQNEVARAIATEVDVKLTPQEEERLRTARRVDPVAFEAYLQGRHFWNKRTEEGMRKALVLFREAVDADPVYARAYAGMADVYNLLAILALEPASEAYPMAKAAAKRAIEIDTSLGEAHTSLALTSILYDWDWSTAEREFLLAIDLTPDYATAHHFYGGYVMSPLGRHGEALEALLRARELDPLAPVLRADTACVLFFAGRVAEAIDRCLETLERFPEFPIPYFYLVDALAHEQRYDEAIDAATRAVELTSKDPNFYARLALALAAGGRRNEAEAVLSELTGNAAPAYPIAITYVYLGEVDRALEWLNKAAERRAWEVLWLNVDARVDALRDHARFQDLLRRMNFPE